MTRVDMIIIGTVLAIKTIELINYKCFKLGWLVTTNVWKFKECFWIKFQICTQHNVKLSIKLNFFLYFRGMKATWQIRSLGISATPIIPCAMP